MNIQYASPTILKPYVLSDTEQKIQNFKNLNQGWHFGEGIAPSSETIDIALGLVKEAHITGCDVDAFPGINGEVQVTLYYDDEYLEFTVENDNSITFVHEKNGIEVCNEEGLDVSDADIRIREATKKCNYLESSIENISIKDWADFKVWHLNQIKLTRIFPSYPLIALKAWATPSANILRNFTQA